MCSHKTRVKRTTRSATVVRERICDGCGCAFRTSESVLFPFSLKVVKAGDRESELFDPQKLARTLDWLSRSHSISALVREEILREVEIQLVVLVGKEVVSTGLLAELLFKSLSRRNPVAARRFASRYVDGDGQPLFSRNLDDLGLGQGESDNSLQLSLFEDVDPE